MPSHDFFYRVGNIICNIPWKRPTKSKLLELMKYFNENFPKAHLFKIALHGGFHSSDYNNTWDIDMTIHFVDMNDKNFQDIYDCFHFLYYHALNNFNVLVDIKYTDKFYHTTHTLYDLVKNKSYKDLESFDEHSLVGDRIDFSPIIEKKYKQEDLKINKSKDIYKNIVNLDNNLQLFILKDKMYNSTFNDKFTKHITNGRIYYKDIIVNESCKINNNYFN